MLWYLLIWITVVTAINTRNTADNDLHDFNRYNDFANDDLQQVTRDRRFVKQEDADVIPRATNKRHVRQERSADLNPLTRQLHELGIGYNALLDDVQARLDEQLLSDADVTTPDPHFYDSYRSYTEMMVYIHSRVAQCGERCTVLKIGKSFWGRDLPVVKISSDTAADSHKPSVWIDAGIHAREWIAPMTALWIMDQLISGYPSNSTTVHVLQTYDWYIMPLVNPDGYQYSFLMNRMWRGTRSITPQAEDKCVGCDANRNFDFNWNMIGSKNDPCSETYAGLYPESEPEVAALSRFVGNSSLTFDFYLTFHSYGQLWMLPYGYTRELPENYDNMMRAARAGADALYQVHGTNYTVGPASYVLYESSGTSRDWAAGVAHIPYTYTLELRAKKNYHFKLPASHIVPTGEETWAGVQELVRFVIDDQQ